jgi:hypothetical protein
MRFSDPNVDEGKMEADFANPPQAPSDSKSGASKGSNPQRPLLTPRPSAKRMKSGIARISTEDARDMHHVWWREEDMDVWRKVSFSVRLAAACA